jgi:fido (protein-threonine AMPylation protein)
MTDIQEFLLHPDLELNEFSKIFPLGDVSSLSEEIQLFLSDYDISKSAWRSAFRSSRQYHLNAFAMYGRLSKVDYENVLIRKFPMLALLLAEALIILSDLIGAQVIIGDLQHQYPHVDLLATLLTRVNSLVDNEQADDDEYFASRDFEMLSDDHGTKITAVATYKQPIPLHSEVEFHSDVASLLIRWNLLQNLEADAMELFVRMACIDTNVIEGVFDFEGQSWSRLIRKGFYENSIEGFSLLSKIKKKSQVVRILKNTARCMETITPILNDLSLFSTAFIMNLHKELLMNDNFDQYEVEDSDDTNYSVFKLIATGRYRTKGISTRHNTSVVQFCHKSSVAEHMEQYAEQARHLLANTSLDPFLKCAWLQWAFLRIHPFEDGNGRVSRILSSLPLLKEHLPPVVVSSKKEVKQLYFDALRAADEDGDVRRLASFLRRQALDGMAQIDKLPSDETFGTNSPGSEKARPTRRISSVHSNSCRGNGDSSDSEA